MEPIGADIDLKYLNPIMSVLGEFGTKVQFRGLESYKEIEGIN